MCDGSDVDYLDEQLELHCVSSEFDTHVKVFEFLYFCIFDLGINPRYKMTVETKQRVIDAVEGSQYPANHVPPKSKGLKHG